MRRDVADTLVISDGEAAGWVDANALCDRGRGDGFRVVCFHPDPYSTQGEARGVARLARESRWRRVALVTSTSHVHRARLLFERCLSGDVEAVGTGHKLRYLLSSLVWESAKLTYALTAERSC
jgi:uncharacterized SAM-binding protein YcdF (DUF218 family)